MKARFLFVVPPLVGHVNPTISAARALEGQGHQVAWAGHADVVGPLLPNGAALVPLDGDVSPETLQRATERANTVRGLAGLKFLWEDFLLPLARATVASVQHAVEAVRPSVLVVDQQMLSGAIVARRCGLRWATFATTSADMVASIESLPHVRHWVEEQMRALGREAGLPDPIDRLDTSPDLVIVCSTRELIGGGDTFPAQYRFVGPSIADRPDTTPFPWDALGEDRVVLVSLGTVNAARGSRFYDTVVTALGGSPIRVVLVAPEGFASAPGNFIVRSRVPQLQLLPRVRAVVCHGGHNTVCEALAHGVPLVVAPIKDDQPVIAEQVVRAGAGLRVRFGRVGPDELREVVMRVLEEPSFRESAAHIQASFAAAGGAAKAAALLECLA